jgi:hypothetical protein
LSTPDGRPAFYALTPGGWRDYWSLLHPPYTLWHLSFVVLGSCVAATIDPGLLGLALLAFFFAVGIAAHALDELHGRPLGTRIPSGVLIALATVSLILAIALGVVGSRLVSWWGVAFILVGGFLVPAYNLGWFGERFHRDVWFAVMWGGFPALVGGFAQTGHVDLALVVLASGCALIAAAQRRLSTPVRRIRRQASAVEGTVTWRDGTTTPIAEGTLREPAEGALRILWVASVATALGLAMARWP